MFPFAVGATTVLFRERATPEKLFELCARHRRDGAHQRSDDDQQDGAGGAARRARWRRCARASRPARRCRPSSTIAGRRRFGVEILDGIGSAELFHIYISNRFGEVRPGSLGRLVPGYDARVVGADGNDVPDGEIGTLWVKGDSAAHLLLAGAREVEGGAARRLGRLRRSVPPRRRRLLLLRRPRRRHAQGRRHLRLADGGRVVPAAPPARARGRGDRLRGRRRIGQTIGLRRRQGRRAVGDAGARASSSTARRELAHYKAPRRVQFVEALPRSDRGKILRRELRS